MDYKEEQDLEIEALESIYADSFDVISTNPTVFALKVYSEEDREVDTFGVNLKFTYPEKYPEDKLVYEISLITDDEDDDEDEKESKHSDLCAKLSELIDEQIEENIGCVVVYDVISTTQDYINEIKDNIKLAREEEKERIEREEKEAEQKKCHGTRVTVASFMEWREKFVEEMRLIEEEEKRKLEKVKKKLTGKEIFIRKGNLADDSEVLEGEEAVQVDESLFEDLDDLDLDDELLDC